MFIYVEYSAVGRTKVTDRYVLGYISKQIKEMSFLHKDLRNITFFSLSIIGTKYTYSEIKHQTTQQFILGLIFESILLQVLKL